MSISHRNRTSTFCIMYALYLYFLGLGFRSTFKAIEPFEKRSHVAVWKWVQRFRSNRTYVRKRVAAFVIDETLIQIGNDVAWLWIAIEPVNRTVLGAYILRDRTMLIAEAVLKTLVRYMVNILFILLEVLGIHKHVISWVWYIDYINHLNRV